MFDLVVLGVGGFFMLLILHEFARAKEMHLALIQDPLLVIPRMQRIPAMWSWTLGVSAMVFLIATATTGATTVAVLALEARRASLTLPVLATPTRVPTITPAPTATLPVTLVVPDKAQPTLKPQPTRKPSPTDRLHPPTPVHPEHPTAKPTNTPRPDPKRKPTDRPRGGGGNPNKK